MIVPDASTAVALFLDPASEVRVEEATRILGEDSQWLVPEHWRVEFLSVMRGLTLAGKLDRRDAESAVSWLRSVQVAVAPTEPHVPRIWELRDDLTTYDAGYVAVAEAHELTLVTADARIARAGVARCPIRLVA